jgi:hypothetical protein
MLALAAATWIDRNERYLVERAQRQH